MMSAIKEIKVIDIILGVLEDEDKETTVAELRNQLIQLREERVKAISGFDVFCEYLGF